MILLPCRSLNSKRLQESLGRNLIHRHCRSQIVRAGIGNSKEIKSRLNPAVLAVEPVQSHKNHISLLADIQNSQSDDGGILPFSRCAHSAKIRSNPVKYHRLQFRKRIKKLLRMCENILSELLQAKEHIHKDCLMPPGPERSADLGS